MSDIETDTKPDTEQTQPIPTQALSPMLGHLLNTTTPAPEHPNIPETLEEAEAQLEALMHKRAAAMDALTKL